MRDDVWWSSLFALLTALMAVANAFGGDRVTLKSGDVLHGTIVANANGALQFDHPELGRLVLPLERVASFGPEPELEPDPVQPPGATPPAAADGVAATVAERPETDGPPTNPLAKRRTGEWKVHAAFALAGNFAVNDEFTMRAGIGAERETDRDKTTLNGEYYYRIFENVTTDNNILVKGLQEWTIGHSAWLFFTQGQYQYDEFEPWTHRLSGHIGPGYRVFDTDRIGLTLRLGAGATYEAGEVHTWEPEVLFAEDFRWRITDRQQVSLNASIAPNVEDFSDFRVQTSLEYQLLLDESKRGLSLTAGLRDIYLSRPAPDAESNELRVYAGLRYDF
ncbi:MAG: DUF481 domain-containing protein [Phycisphaerae bacterium]|nr:DUF481 domain-containing protein [Phycisphaerae bacterium]